MNGTTKNKGKKDNLDRFYTLPDNAIALVNMLLERYPRLSNAIFIEPSAGAGAFVYALEQNTSIDNEHIFAFDIQPCSSSICSTPIYQYDFLSDRCRQRLEEIINTYNKDIVFIGNPPFGEQGNLCFDFINRCFEYGRHVAFILPPTFQKPTYRKRITGDIIDVFDIEDIHYDLSGKKINVPSKFFLFDREKSFVNDIDKQTASELLDKLPFTFARIKDDVDKRDCDFTIRRIGGNAGKASSNLEFSAQSNYFCKKKDNCPNNIIEIINSCDFPEKDWSVGPASISKIELAKHIVEVLE